VAGLGVTESTAAWLMLPSVIAMTIGAPVVGKMLDLIGSRLIVQFGLAWVFAGLLIYAEATMTVAIFIIGGIVGGIGLASLLGAPFRYIVLHEARPEDRAAGQGLLTVFLSVGQLLGAAIVGGVAASGGGGTAGYQAAFLALAVLTGALCLVAMALKSRRVEQAERAAAA
jgi:MFS family permease